MTPNSVLQLLGDQGADARVSATDIAGLALGAGVAILAPVAFFLFLRGRFRIQVRFVLLGAATAIGGYALLSFVFPMLWRALDFAVEVVLPNGLRAWGGFSTFENAFRNAAATEIFHLSLELLSLGILARSDRTGRPTLALGIGACGWVCWIYGRGLVEQLMLALHVNEVGLEATFGQGEMLPQSITDMFGAGLPSGASAVSRFAFSLVLLLVARRGWQSRRWRWVAGTYGAAIVAAAAGGAVHALAYSHAQLRALEEWSSISPGQLFDLALGASTVVAVMRRRRFFTELVSAEAPVDKPEPDRLDDHTEGILATWRRQSSRG